MKLNHKQARQRFEAALDNLHYSEQKPEIDPALAEHLKRCSECRAYVEQAAGVDAHLFNYMSGAWPVPSFTSQEMDQAIHKVHNRARRRRMIHLMTKTTRRAILLIGFLALITGFVWFLNSLYIQRPSFGEDSMGTAVAPAIGNDTNNVTITFADFGGFEQQYQPIIQDFQDQYPNILVQYVSLNAVPGQTGLASQADVIVLPQLPQGSDIYNYLDLEPLEASDKSLESNTFWPGLLDACQVQDRMIGLPLYVQPSLIFFNGAIFNNAGIERPAPGWTWDDFQNAAIALSNGSGDQNTQYGFTGSTLSLLVPQIDAILRKTGGEIQVSDFSQEFGWFVTLVRQGNLKVFSVDGDPFEFEQTISNEQAAMWVGNISELSNWKQKLGADISVAPFPISSSEMTNPSNPTSNYCVAISAGSRNPQEAWDWINFLSKQPVPTRSPGDVPGRSTVAQASGYWDNIDNQTESAILFALEHGWYGSAYPDVLVALEAAFQQASTGKDSLDNALASISSVKATALPPLVSTPVAVVPPQTTAMPEEIPEDATVVEYFSWESIDNEDAVKALAKEFNRSQQDVYVRVTDNTEAFGTLGFSTDQIIEGYDCFSGWIAPAQTDVVYDLAPLVETDPEGNALIDDFPASVWSFAHKNSSIFGLPVASNPIVTYYNRDHFLEQGIEPPTLDWTINDFWALASATTIDDVFGFLPLEDYSFLFTAQDIELIDLASDPPKVNFNNPETLQIVTILADQVNNGVMPMFDKRSYIFSIGDSHGFPALLSDAKVAMWTFRGGFPFGDWTDNGYSVGVLPLPGGRGTLNPESVISIFISRHAENPTACWQWAKFLSSRPGAFLGVPIRKSVLSSQNFKAMVGPDAAAAYWAVMAQPYIEPPPIEIQLQYPTYPLRIMWSTTLYAILNGANAGQLLVELQNKGEIYLGCIASLDLRDGDPLYANKVNECARKADPNY